MSVTLTRLVTTWGLCMVLSSGCATPYQVEMGGRFKAAPMLLVPAKARTFEVLVTPQNGGDDVTAVERASAHLKLDRLQQIPSASAADLVIRVVSPGFSETHSCNQVSSEGLRRSEGSTGEAGLHRTTSTFEACSMRGVMSASWRVLNRDGSYASRADDKYFRQTKADGGNLDAVRTDLAKSLLAGYRSALQSSIDRSLKTKSITINFLLPRDTRFPELEVALNYVRGPLRDRINAGPGKLLPGEKEAWKQAETIWIAVYQRANGDDINHLLRLLSLARIQASLFQGDEQEFNRLVNQLKSDMKGTIFDFDDELHESLEQIEAFKATMDAAP